MFTLLFLSLLPANVDSLIKQLGSREFETRKEAYVKLLKLEERAIPYLKKALSNDDFHTRYFADKLIFEYYNVFKIPNYDKMPSIGNLSHKTTSYIRVIAKYEYKVDVQGLIKQLIWDSERIFDRAGFKVGFAHGNPECRYATYVLAKFLLKKGIPKKQVMALLIAMAREEKYWEDFLKRRK